MDVQIVLAVLIAMEGLYSIITGKMIGNQNRKESKYTEDSLRKYNRIIGVLFIAIAGVIMAVNFLPDSKDDLQIILLVCACVVGVLVIILAGKLVLVKIGSPKAKGKGGPDRYIDED